MFNKLKESKETIAFTKNSYSTVTVAVVIAIVVIFNLILNQLAGTSLQFDMNDSNIYEMTEITTELLDGLDSEITFTILAQEAYVDSTVITYIERYTDQSDYIEVEWIDPVLYPSAMDTYGTTSDTIVIGCEATGKTTIVSIADIYYFDEMSYYYYGTYSYVFDGEGLFTSAISQVTTDVEYKAYTVSGHGEYSLPDTITELMTKNSVVTEDLNLLTTTEIPEDCELLIINSPTSDITEGEKILLSDYLSAGGNVLLLMADPGIDTPNFDDLLLEYGMDAADGYIADLERAYQGNGYYIIPNLSISGDMATDMTSQSVLIVNTGGFTETTPERDTISLSTFMTTSDNSVAVTEDGEVSGTYVLGAAATETITLDDESTVESRFTVYGSYNIINEEVTTVFTSLENTTLFMNSVMMNFDGSTNVSIASITIEETYNVVSDPNMYSMLFVVMIPLGVLVAGFVVWNGRRKQ